MHWLIQEDIFKEVHYSMLIELMEKYKLNYQIVKVLPFINEIQYSKPVETNNVFCFGSVKLARIAKQNNWYPGSLLNDNHDYEVYASKFGYDNMLNGDSIIYKFSDKIDFERGLKFIRPTKDSKVFTGKVFDIDEWEDFVQNSLTNGHSTILDKNTLIQVCNPKNIQQEVRNWVVKGKIVTSSFYKLGSLVYYQECKEPEFIDFAQQMVDKFQVADGFVIDIALTDGKYKIVECNCINCSGFYKGDLSKLIQSLMVFDTE